MKVLLVDDHPLILSAMQAVIHGVGSHITVVGVESAAAARAAMRADGDFDLVLLDLSLGDADGFDVLVEFRSTYPAVPVVVASASERTSDVIRAIDSGAMGFIPKSTSNAELQHALGLVMEGSMYVPPSMLGLVFQRPSQDGDTVPDVMRVGGPPEGALTQSAALAEPHPKPPTLDDVGLTPRQTEVLGLLLQGLPNKLIARQLNLSVETVKDHVAAVLRALGVSSRTQAVLAVSQMTQGQGGWFTRRTPPR